MLKQRWAELRKLQKWGEPSKKHRVVGTKTYIVLDNLVLAALLRSAAVHDYDMQSDI